MNNISIDKSSLRRQFAALRERLSPKERTAAEAAIRDKLFSLPAWENAPLVCGYMPVRSEIDTSPIWERAITKGGSYALPVTVTGAREGQMLYRRLQGFTPEALIPARFGIPEPAAHCPALSPGDLAGALILVPGLAFDDQGFRIGYGGGYYDRFLSDLRRANVPFTAVGLAFSVCRPPVLPHEPHDIPVDYVIDERRMTVTHGIRA